jgi:hypothetical protein
MSILQKTRSIAVAFFVVVAAPMGDIFAVGKRLHPLEVKSREMNLAMRRRD